MHHPAGLLPWPPEGFLHSAESLSYLKLVLLFFNLITGGFNANLPNPPSVRHRNSERQLSEQLHCTVRLVSVHNLSQYVPEGDACGVDSRNGAKRLDASNWQQRSAG